jgi:hypothetical protein
MTYGYKTDHDLRLQVMPEVYYRGRDNKHKYIINFVKNTYQVERVLILVK